QLLSVPAHQRVGGERQIDVLEALGAFLAVLPVPDDGGQLRRESLYLALPVGQHAGRRHYQRRFAPFLVFHLLQQGQRLQRLSQAHVVRQNSRQSVPVEEPEPRQSDLLVMAQRSADAGRQRDRREAARLFQLAHRLARVGFHLDGRAQLGEQLER